MKNLIAACFCLVGFLGVVYAESSEAVERETSTEARATASAAVAYASLLKEVQPVPSFQQTKPAATTKPKTSTVKPAVKQQTYTTYYRYGRSRRCGRWGCR